MKNMDINLSLKLRSLLRRKKQFFCISYDWENRQIVITEKFSQYQMQLAQLKNTGAVKRAECYLDQIFHVSQNQQYLIYMISFGDFRKEKMVRGQNPLAKGFGVCLFDYVYIFLDTFRQAQIRMIARIQQMEKKSQFFHRNLMLSLYYKYFPQQSQNTQTSQFFCSFKHCIKQQNQQSFQV